MRNWLRLLQHHPLQYPSRTSANSVVRIAIMGTGSHRFLRKAALRFGPASASFAVNNVACLRTGLPNRLWLSTAATRNSNGIRDSTGKYGAFRPKTLGRRFMILLPASSLPLSQQERLFDQDSLAERTFFSFVIWVN